MNVTARSFLRTLPLFIVMLTGCGGAHDGVSDAEAEARSAPAFVADSTTKTITIDGMSVTLLRSPDALRDGAFARMQENAAFGVAFEGYAARLSPADAAAITSDPAKLAAFADKMLEDAATGAPAEDVRALDRGGVFGEIVAISHFEGDPWPERAAFEKDARIATRSLLSVPTTAIFHATYCPDWCDEAIIAVTSTGEIRLLHQFGDI
jgi:hypothetical protein